MTLQAKPGLPAGQDSPRTRRTDLRASLVAVAACGAALALGAFVIFGRNAALSAGIGAAVALVNLWTLGRIVSAMLREERGGFWASAAFLKMLALFVVFGLLMRYAAVSPLAMIVGFGALPIGVVIGAVLSDRSPPL